MLSIVQVNNEQKSENIFRHFLFAHIVYFSLFYVFNTIEINRLNEFSYYKELQTNLDNFISADIFINTIYFFIFSVIWVALLGFGSPILIISGILFGQYIGTLISVISISVGSLILYSIGIFFFRDLVRSILEKKFEKYIQLFQKNEFFTFLFID